MTTKQQKIEHHLDNLKSLSPFISTTEYNLREKVLLSELKKCTTPVVVPEEKKTVLSSKMKEIPNEKKTRVGFLLPRENWGVVQKLRSCYLKEVNVGPICDVLNGFVKEESFGLIQEELSRFLEGEKAFQVVLREFKCVYRRRIAMLVLVADYSEGYERVMERIAEVFPQVRREEDRFYVTIGSFRSRSKCRELKERMERSWEPLVVKIKELNFLARDQTNEPYRVSMSVPLGNKYKGSSYGSLIPGSSSARTIVVLGISNELSERNVMQFFEGKGFQPTRAEFICNPDREKRFPIVEFSNDTITQNVVDFFKDDEEIKVEFLYNMSFPDKLDGTTSVYNLNVY